MVKSKRSWYNFDINSISEDSSNENILEVDLEYPNELHLLCNGYALAPEKLQITYNMLSNYLIKFQMNMA